MADTPCTDIRIAQAFLRAGSRPVPAPAGALRAEGVTAWFDKRCVVAGVHLDVAAGSVTSIIGPPGCGKSTFLRTLNRMHELGPAAALAGAVHLDGVDIYAPGTRPALVRLRIGMVFPIANPFPTMSIADNVLSGLRLAGIPCPDKADVSERCLTEAGLWNEVKDRLGVPAGVLSGGQQQRLCIARSLAVRPRVLLLDDPCSALDLSSTLRLEETIRDLSSSVTIVIATSDARQAARVSDHTAFLLAEKGYPGRLVEFGATGELFDAPNDPRTEDYLEGLF